MARRKHPLTPKPRKAVVADHTGARPLTKAELRHLGLSENSRQYTTQKAGIKLSSLKREKAIPRRRAEKVVVASYEKAAKTNRVLRGGASPTDEYYRVARQYQEESGGVFSIADIRRDPDFQKNYRALRNQSKKPGPTKQRLEALYFFGYIDADQLDRYIESYVGENE